MPTSFQTVRGMRDLIEQDAQSFLSIISTARQTARIYGYKEVITPHVEPLELLSAKAGDEIRQRMFIFKDLGERQVALRPEFTASIARLITTVLRNYPKPLRLFSVGTVYRYDEPQKGRYREFWQSNYELMGSDKPEADAEIILLTDNLMSSLGLRNYVFKIGHIGVVRSILNQDSIDEKTQNNILQLMDKKDYEKASSIIESEKARNAIEGLTKIKGKDWKDILDKMKLHLVNYDKAIIAIENLSRILSLISLTSNLTINVDPAFARGLEYYTGMIFEIYIPSLDIALGGGGRYNRLIEVFGGEPTPAVGCAHGIDRVNLALLEQKIDLNHNPLKRVAVIAISEALKSESLKIAQQLRMEGISVDFEVMGRKMVKALEDADKRKVDFAIIVGEREFKESCVMLKDLSNRTQELVPIIELVGKIKK